jgi:ATP-binding cassette subfamily B protein
MAYAIGLALGAFLFEEHQITLGTAYLIVFYIGMLTDHLDGVRRQVQQMQEATAGIARVDTLLRTESVLKEGGTATLPPGPLAVCFDHVSFSYEDGESVLRNLSFSLEPGTTLGLLGRTGSGKTTLTRLLARLYDPTEGSISLNGVDLRELTMDPAAGEGGLRRRVGTVTQDVHFFKATVRDNITFFHPPHAAGARDEDILRVFRELDLWEWYQSLPDGLDTMLGPGGAGLSAGEAQLLAFARVFLQNPGLVILDEATSRLDPATERHVEHAIDRLLAGRTAIVVAHRLRTVGRVDEIMILEDGRIAERGRRVELLQEGASRFSSLLRVGMEEVLV